MRREEEEILDEGGGTVVIHSIHAQTVEIRLLKVPVLSLSYYVTRCLSHCSIDVKNQSWQVLLKKKHLIGGLIWVVEGRYMIIMAGRMAPEQ